MSKRFKGKTCVYCCGEGISATGDHVFAREFFLKTQRANLPQVPACTPCNKDKGDLEHYLTAVLPFGGRHNDALTNLESMVPPRLAKNAKLHRRLDSASSRIWTKDKSGLHVRTTTLPLDGERLERLFAYITRGLMWHHWQVLLPDDCFVEVHCLTALGDRFFQQYVGMNAARRVAESIGGGTFEYKGAQGTDNPQVSVWHFTIYGGLQMSGSTPDEQIRSLGAFSGPIHIQESAERRTRSGTIIRPVRCLSRLNPNSPPGQGRGR